MFNHNDKILTYCDVQICHPYYPYHSLQSLTKLSLILSIVFPYIKLMFHSQFCCLLFTLGIQYCTLPYCLQYLEVDHFITSQKAYLIFPARLRKAVKIFSSFRGEIVNRTKIMLCEKVWKY